jgi:hypothetical protein
VVCLGGGGAKMERKGDKAKTEESSCGGARPVGWLGPQQGQEARQQRERAQGWSGQKPQENVGSPAQCSLATAWTPQRLNLLIEIIRARFGDYAIGRGNSGIRYSSPSLGQG